MDELRDKLLRKAYLYADAEAYRAGVVAALAAVQADEQPTSEDVDEDAVVLLSLER